MTALVDSHCHLDHLDLTHYQGNLDLAISAAEKEDVQHFLCVCIDLMNFPKVLAIAEQYDQVFASVGLHPNENTTEEPKAETLIKLGRHPKVIAIGETGLDYFRSEGDLHWQQQRFREHILAAQSLQKPLIIHTRQARADTIKILVDTNAASVGGVMHCFTEDWETAKRALDLGFYISFSGIITFKNATELQEVVKKVPLDRLLIETDAPYLAPVPYRGKPNEPAYVRLVAEQVAMLKNLSYEKVAEISTANFFRLFFKK